MTPSPLSHVTEPEWTIVTTAEYETISLSAEEILGPGGRLNLASGVINRYVKPGFSDGIVSLSAQGVLGLIPITNHVAVQVRPRFPIRNLTHMLTVTGRPTTILPALRDYKTTEQSSAWIVDVMADALLLAIDTISSGGLLRDYHRRIESGSYPHGRIDMTTTATRLAARGVNHEVQFSWFERTADIAPNRCVKAALMTLHGHYARDPHRAGVRSRIARLANALRLFEEVEPESWRTSLADPIVRGTAQLPQSRSYYRPTLDLAVAILTGRGIDIDTDSDDLAAPTLLVEMEDLFEDFVRVSLQSAMSSHPDLSVLDGNAEGKKKLYEPILATELSSLPTHRLVRGRVRDAQPDIVFRRLQDQYPLIADAKYTNVVDYAKRTEVEQVVLYGHRYKSPVAMTIHPRLPDSEKGLFIAGRIGSTIVAQYRLDLGAPDLVTEVREMADTISGLIASQIES